MGLVVKRLMGFNYKTLIDKTEHAFAFVFRLQRAFASTYRPNEKYK